MHTCEGTACGTCRGYGDPNPALEEGKTWPKLSFGEERPEGTQAAVGLCVTQKMMGVYLLFILLCLSYLLPSTLFTAFVTLWKPF